LSGAPSPLAPGWRGLVRRLSPVPTSPRAMPLSGVWSRWLTARPRRGSACAGSQERVVTLVAGALRPDDPSEQPFVARAPAVDIRQAGEQGSHAEESGDLVGGPAPPVRDAEQPGNAARRRALGHSPVARELPRDEGRDGVPDRARSARRSDVRPTAGPSWKKARSNGIRRPVREASYSASVQRTGIPPLSYRVRCSSRERPRSRGAGAAHRASWHLLAPG